jgi:peroxiredoxin Q/BCP
MKLGFTLLLGAASTVVGRAQTPVELKVGDDAPNFSLRGSDGRTYTLADYKGKSAVVLAWFPKAFTGGWTIECKSLRESGEAIRAFHVAYFTSSVDDAETNAKFAQHVEADYPILADPTKDTARAYGVLGMAGVASRWTFYIGIDGKILHIDKSVKVSSAGQDIANKLAELGVAKRWPRAARAWSG